MAKRANYGFEKRKREADTKAKQEQKLLRKREAAEQKRADTPEPTPEEAAGEPATTGGTTDRG